MKALNPEFYLTSPKYFLLNRLLGLFRDTAVSLVVMAVVIFISYLIRIVLIEHGIS